MNFDPHHISHCLTLAEKGLGQVAPNPLVGAVIVCDGEIIGEGYHQKFGGPHAEVNAINSVQDRSVLGRSTLYINLEPCCHFGKTPPCTDLILQHGIKNVVVSCTDPFPDVAGKGIEKLREAGVTVVVGILEEEARFLNRRFFTFHEKRRPYVILKWAETSDGFIAKSNYESKWISSEESRKLVHQWRAQEMAVMVGTNTAVYDNPRLTCRLAQGKNPTRVLLDKDQRVPTSFHIFDESAPTILFNEIEDFEAKTAHLIKIDFAGSIVKQVLDHLHAKKIESIMVEGGTVLLQSFIDSGLWDEMRIFKSRTVEFRNGIAAPRWEGEAAELLSVGTDELSFVFQG